MLDECMNDFIVDRKKRTIVTPLGKMEFGNIVLIDECLELYLDIEKVTDELQSEIDQKIHDSAIALYKEREERYREHGILSTDEIKMREIYKALDLSLERRNIKSYISIGAIDEKTETLEADILIPIDIQPFFDEIKSIVLKTIEQRYF